MFAVFKEESILSALMFSTLVLSILGKIMLGVLYQNMIRETENMRATENKALKQCKLKFANCYQLHGGVANISVFVDKYLTQLRMGPFTTQTFYQLCGQGVLLSVLFAGVAICRLIIAGAGAGKILPFYIVCFLGLYLHFSVSAIADVKGRRKTLKVNLVDFLENHMVSQLERDEESEVSPRQKIELMPVIPKRQEKNPVQEFDRMPERVASPISFLEQEELEALLKEFLTS